MAVSRANPKADFYFSKNEKWEKEIKKLRSIALSCELNEEVKWGCPCYTLNGQNIVLIHVFKEYCALLFFKGALLKDSKKILVQQTANVQAARQLRFTDLKEITSSASIIKTYIFEAIEIEKAGVKVVMKKTAEFTMSLEFEKKLKSSALIKKAFNALTPGRQRGYLLYFSQAKQTTTREARIEKSIPRILQGKGLDD